MMRKVFIICIMLIATALWSTGLDAQQYDTEECFQMAAKSFAQGDFEKAYDYLRAAKRLEPDNEQVNKLMRVVRKELGLSKSDLEEITTIQPAVRRREELEVEVSPGSEEEKISLEFKDTDISTVLSALSVAYGLNIIAGKGVTGKITVSLKDVDLQVAIDTITELGGYIYTRKGSIITIKRKEEEELVTKVIQVDFKEAGEVKDTVQKILSKRGTIEVDDVSNTLVITDVPENIEKIKDVIKQVDVPPKQVMIEARLIDITRTDLSNLGINWTYTYTAPGIFYHKGGDDETATTTVNVPGPSSSLLGSEITLGLTFQNAEVSATIDTLIQQGKANLLASPSIVTLNNEEAKIIIGEKVPYREETLTAVGTTETTKFIDVGVTLRVTPRISKSGLITMKIHPEVSSVSDILDAGPRISTREADTTIMVRSGQTIVIAGLIKNQLSQTRSKIPILGDLPLVGNLFRNKSVSKTMTELAVFITPYIIEPARFIKMPEEDHMSPSFLFSRAVGMLDDKGIESWSKPREVRSKQALEIFKRVLKDYPYFKNADEVQYRVAMIYYKELSRLYTARREFNKLIDNYPDSRYVDESVKALRRINKKLKRRTRRR